MALPLGKLTILVGAGILGSVLAKEGRMPNITDVLSGALKFALKPIKQNDSASTASKPRKDALMAQVDSLRRELQLLASNRPMTIVTSSTSGGRQYGFIIVIVVIGCGYVWWKGWKLPHLMFATKRSLSDACNTVATELEEVYSSIRDTRRELASKLDRTNHELGERVTFTATISDEAKALREDVPILIPQLEGLASSIQDLEARFGTIHGKQGMLTKGVGKLLLHEADAENRSTDCIQGSPSSPSRLAIEHPQIATCSRTGSLPPALSIELPSSSAPNGSTEVKTPLRNAKSAAGFEESQGICGAMVDSPCPSLSNGNHVRRTVSNGSCAPQNTEDTPFSTAELPPRQPNVRITRVFSRTVSVTQNLKF